LALQSERPDLSAGPSGAHRSVAIPLGLSALAAAALIAAPGMVLLACEFVLALIFFAWTLLRVTGALVRPPPRHIARPLPDAELPTYTVLVSLYREVAAVPGLVRALQNLDYPPEKLEVKFVTEADDVETRAAIEALHPGAPFEIFIAPEAGPRTKPK